MGPTFTKKIEGFADVCFVWALGYTILFHPAEKNMLPMKMAFVVAYPYFHTHYHQDPVHQRLTLVGRFDGNSLAYVFLQPCLTVHWLLGLVLTLELASFHSTGQTANQQSSLFIVDS